MQNLYNCKNPPLSSETTCSYLTALDRRTIVMHVCYIIFQMRQFIGILGFLFTNAYVAYRYFNADHKRLKHLDFKFALSDKLVNFTSITMPAPRYVGLRSYGNFITLFFIRTIL